MFCSGKKILIYSFFIAFLFQINLLPGQTVTFDFPVANANLRVVVDEGECPSCATSWLPDYNCFVWGGISYDPAGDLYGIDGSLSNDLYLMDPLASSCILVFSPSTSLPKMDGMIAMGGGIFYSMVFKSDILYRWDINAGTVSVVGNTGYPCWGDLCLSNGKAYYLTREFIPPNSASVIQLDLANPSNSTSITDFDPSYGIFGITATTDPNTLYAIELYLNGGDADLYRLSLLDGSLIFICTINPSGIVGSFPQITSPLEHDLLSPEVPFIDLDCDDSSGALGSDFNALPFNCKSSGTHIIDVDPRIRSDALISEMAVKLLAPTPDSPDEFLDLSGSAIGINVSGQGTTMLTFTNTGSGTLPGFLELLSYTVYLNLSFHLTPGPRSVEVKFTSTLGTTSNTARAFFQVEEWPQVEIDLGPDIIACEGESVTLSANNPGEMYLWSTGEENEEISVSTSGTYIITVSNNIDCPNIDSIHVDFLPLIHVWLTGDDEVCEGEEFSLVIGTDAPFPIDVTITPNQGTPIVFAGIIDSVIFSDVLFYTTEFTISEVIPSVPACPVLDDPDQIIEVWSTYSGLHDNASLCLGDSILLGNTFYADSGIYNVAFQTIHGCDSIVVYTIDLLPTEHIFLHSSTCDPAMAGTYLTFLPNQSGCDTVVHHISDLLPIDTIHLFQSTCLSSAVGILIDTLTNQFGCDSFIILSIVYDPPDDTTQILTFTCDSASLGKTFQTLISSQGCDSIVQTNFQIPVPDTTLINLTSCDTSIIGTLTTIYNNHEGCDSIVIKTISLITNDSIYVYTTSCDSNSLGNFITVFPLANACDSVVITQVDFAAADTTYLMSVSCNASDTGVITSYWTNHIGCDSVVIHTTTLLPSTQISLFENSCIPSDTGFFIHVFTNMFGCDSIIGTHVSLLPSNSSEVFFFTCDISQAGQISTHFQNQFGCDSVVIQTTYFVPADTTTITSYTCEPNQVGEVHHLFENQAGCDSLILEITELYPLPQLTIISMLDYNGFDVSCYGSSDATLLAQVAGISPFEYLWSTGDNQALLENLPADIYSVTLTDMHGCIDIEEVELNEPEPLSLTFLISEPDCFEDAMGVIEAVAEGGAAPYLYSFDSLGYSTKHLFDNLTNGIYKIFVSDANDCLASEIIAIHIPFPVSVDLGDDQVIDIGDSIHLLAVVNVSPKLLDSIRWSGLNVINCDTCLRQTIAPVITSTYGIQVINNDGCKAEDQVTVSVVINDNIYIPNVFSPNGDGVNDVAFISAGSFVSKILSWEIFDRWGNLDFEIHDADPKDPSTGWDGTYQSKPLNSAVFAYQLVVELKDGSQSILFGNITLLR